MSCRRSCLPKGCDRSPSPFATCVPQLQCNGTGMCNASFQWCNLKGMCLPVGEPCSTYDPWSDCVTPRYNGTRPAYGLVGEVLLCLPAGPPFLVNVSLVRRRKMLNSAHMVRHKCFFLIFFFLYKIEVLESFSKDFLQAEMSKDQMSRKCNSIGIKMQL